MAAGGAKERARAVLALLRGKYPGVKVALEFSNPLELLIATILSAQCTDVQVNRVTRELFRKYRAPGDYVSVAREELEEDIRPTGFYRNKARSIQGCCAMLLRDFGGEVPRSLAELTRLPGVARKTANVVLYGAFGISEGIAVDTHVRRVSQRLGFTGNTSPDRIERDLMELLPREDWGDYSLLVIRHGRETCTARKPKCDGCLLNKLCPSAFKF